jgi:hypothetical protein
MRKEENNLVKSLKKPYKRGVYKAFFMILFALHFNHFCKRHTTLRFNRHLIDAFG